VTVPLDVLPDRLVAHLSGWIGHWPPTSPPTVVGNARNDAPGWDGQPHPVTGVVDPDGAAVVGVPARQAAAVVAALDGQRLDLPRLVRLLPGLLDMPRHRIYTGVLRWTTTPVDLPDAGDWVDADAEVVPDWLRPFGGQVLIALDEDGDYVAGVGIKRHDADGHELSVGTEPAARGKGLARRLVAQAARRVLAEGKVPTYLHDPANIGSAKVADAAGFPDRGWRVLGMFEPEAPEVRS
jgi:GNAT superfamily N-acetyltransferase